jgi:hypothetical protein
MSADFTPGPWRVSCVRTRLGGEPVLQIQAADEKTYALVFYSDKTPEQHRASYADAFLIAAAPELYEALEGLLRCPDRQSEDVAQDALAKARGKSP